MFPFERPGNYSEMLNKIGLFTCIEAILLTVFVGHSVASVNTALSYLKIPAKVYDIDIPILYVVPGIALAILMRITRAHNVLSDIFQIRERFDLFRVLIPLAWAVKSHVGLEELEKNRKRAMARTFYPYASFNEPAISKELVLSSIDAWTWYWILLELIFLLGLTSLFLVWFHAFESATFALAGFSLGILLFPTVFSICGRKAKDQIAEIVSVPERVTKIQAEFAALSGNNEA